MNSFNPGGRSLLLFGAVFGPLFLVAMLYPLVPKTFNAWLLCIGAGVLAGIWAAAAALLIAWLQRQQRYKVICRSVAFVVAISLGAGILWMSISGRDYVGQSFSYFAH